MKNLKIDHWSIMFIASFTTICTASVALSTPNIFIVSLGGFLFGIGEHINHTKETTIYLHETIKTERTLMASDYIRSPKLIGIIFDIVGILLSILGIAKILMHAS